MSPLVVDASVAAKWVFPEIHGDIARNLLSMTDLLAPDLLWAELGNVVWRRRRQGEFDASTARGMLADLRSLEIRSCPMSPLLPSALDIALSLDHSLYDCLYLALAEDEDRVVVTADRRFLRVAAGSTWADRVVWIEDVA